MNRRPQKQRWIKCEHDEQLPMHNSWATNNFYDEFGHVLKQHHVANTQLADIIWNEGTSYFSTSWTLLFWTCDCVCLSIAENLLLVMDGLVNMEQLWNNMDRGKLKCLEENLYVSLFHHKAHMDTVGSNLGFCGGRPVSAWPMAWPSLLLDTSYNTCNLGLKVTDVIQEAERMPQTQTTPWRQHTPLIRQRTRFDMWQNEYWASGGKRISHWVFCRKQKCGDKFQMSSLQCGLTY